MENHSPAVIRAVSKELAELTQSPPEGIKFHLNEQNITDIQCTITGPAGTPYSGGQFRVKLSLPKDFPNSPPRGFFQTKVFHPNVAVPSGEICVNTLKKDWKPDLGIKHILLTIKCLLIAPNPESALNEEAGRLLLEDYQSYATRAKMVTEIHALPRGVSTEQGASNSGTKRTEISDPALKKAKERSKKMLKRL